MASASKHTESPEPPPPQASATAPVLAVAPVAPAAPAATSTATAPPAPMIAPPPIAPLMIAPLIAPPPMPARPDPDAAWVSVGSPSDPRGTTPASVANIVVPLAPRFTDCYRAALRRGSSTPGDVEGAATLHLETGDDGVIVDARYQGPLAAALSACIASAVKGRKVPNVDTGSASADVPVALHAR